jgi:perosamine synthetase
MIPQIEPWIDHGELDELRRVIDSTFLVEHERTREFEAMTRELTGARHAIAVCNGTMALYCCLLALGIGPGDEVLVPDMTFIATANAVIMAGAVPVFCDILPDTYCLDPEDAERMVTPRTKAVMPVHLYGQSADMERILAFAKRHGLFVIEDAAQGVGVRYRGRHVGTFGELGILSYYGNKTITCGEGGIVLTDDDELARAVYRLKNHGRDRKGVFIHEHIGFNFSFTDLQAAVGIAQMKKLPAIIERKRQIHDFYQQALADVPQVRPVALDPQADPVFWFTSYRAEDVEGLAGHLSELGIQTRRFFYPLHMQPCYQGRGLSNRPFPAAEEAYRHGLSLPSSYRLTQEQLDRVVSGIRQYHGLPACV